MSQICQGLLPIELMIEHAELDHQHNEIFCRIEAIKESALASGQPPHDEVGGLIAYFADHFATEERLAEAAGIEFSAHVQAHSHALRVLHKARNDLGSGRLDLRTFLRYLEYWFEQHINDFDKPLGRSLSRLSASRPRSGAAASLSGHAGLTA